MRTLLIRGRTLLPFCLLVVTASAGLAQSYPAKPVRLVVPFAPGGGVDVTARILAQQLTQRAGQTFLVENRTGASGWGARCRKRASSGGPT